MWVQGRISWEAFLGLRPSTILTSTYQRHVLPSTRCLRSWLCPPCSHKDSRDDYICCPQPQLKEVVNYRSVWEQLQSHRLLTQLTVSFLTWPSALCPIADIPTFVRKQQSGPAELVPTSAVVSLAMSRVKEGKCKAHPLLCEHLLHSTQKIDMLPAKQNALPPQ